MRSGAVKITVMSVGYQLALLKPRTAVVLLCQHFAE
jgi:hypothetical protein